MGLFHKRADTTAAEAVATLDQAWKDDPVMVLAHFVQSTGDPLLAVAHLLVRLVASGVLSHDDLAALGIDETELRRVVAILQSDAPSDALYYEAEVHAAIRAYEADVDEIISAAGVVLDEDQRAAFQTNLSKFAYENELTDLKVAYRLMRAEVGDPLAGLAKAHKPGYL